jgi:hypothetical protein
MRTSKVMSHDVEAGRPSQTAERFTQTFMGREVGPEPSVKRTRDGEET